MIERVIENWLINSNERQYQIPFCQLLSAEGESILEISTHHPHEKGKDVLTRTSDGKIKAYQLKAGRIDLATWHTIEGEINDLVELPVEHPSIRNKPSHQPVLVTNGDITPPVLDLIRSKNEAFRRRHFPQLHLVVKGELLKRFSSLHGHYLPKDPQDFGRLLKLILHGGKNPLDKESLSVFLPTALPLGTEATNARNVERAVASTTVLMSYILSGCEAAGNHWAVLEGWVMMAAYSLAAMEKNGISKRDPQTSYSLCLLGAERALDALVEESLTNPTLIEGDVMTDGYFFRYRLTILIGLIGAWRLRQRDASSPRADEALKFIEKNLKNAKIWGESAVPFFVLGALMLEKYSRQSLSEALVSSLITAVAVGNGNDAGTSPGLPNPYYSPEAAVRLAAGLDPDNLETFRGFTYTVQPLVHFLTRRWRKRELSRLWYSITRISLNHFKPDHHWQWLTWRSSSGKLITSFAKEPEKWGELLRASENIDTSHIPVTLKERPDFLALFILVFPHRYDAASQRLLDEWCLASPKDAAQI